MKIKWIVLDMDGTLLDSNKQLPPTFFELKEQLEEKGVKFVLASGRQYDRMRTVVSPFENDFYYLSDNGTKAHHADQFLFEETIEPELAKQIIEKLQAQMNYPLVINATDASYFSCDISEEELRVFKEYYESYELVDDLTTVENVIKITIYDALDEFKNMEILDEFMDKSNITHSGPTWIDIIPKQASKGLSLTRLSNEYNIDLNDVVVFGDAMNDYDMLHTVGYPIIMENADERLKQYGFRMTSSNDDDGVTRILEELLENDDLL